MDRQYRDTVALLLDVTPFIFKQKCFAMKGGTAINLFCRDMPRLSVDIDLVYVDSQVSDRAAALAAIENSLRRIATELKARLGVRIQRTTSGSAQETKLFVSRGDIRVKIDAFARKPFWGWLSKKRQMQGAQLSSNEAYLRTSKPRDDCSNAAVGEFLRRHQD